MKSEIIEDVNAYTGNPENHENAGTDAVLDCKSVLGCKSEQYGNVQTDGNGEADGNIEALGEEIPQKERIESMDEVACGGTSDEVIEQRLRDAYLQGRNDAISEKIAADTKHLCHEGGSEASGTLGLEDLFKFRRSVW